MINVAISVGSAGGRRQSSPLKVTKGSCWKDSPFKRFTVAGSAPRILVPSTFIPAANAQGNKAESVNADEMENIVLFEN